MAAMTSFHAEKRCYLVSAHSASHRCICSSVRQSLTYSTYVGLLVNYHVIMSRGGTRNDTTSATWHILCATWLFVT